MVGGGEILRDEQIYVAHKCANPSKYMPPESTLDDRARTQIKQYKPTDVQLQVWDDLCHVGPTLSFTRPAKYMYRSVAQFSAWALAKAQKTDIEILDDEDISVISSSTSDSDADDLRRVRYSPKSFQNIVLIPFQKDEESNQQESRGQIGKAGEALPPFKNHMIRQRVTRHGVIFPLPPSSELPGCTMDRDLVGVIKQGPVKKWLNQRRQWDQRFATTKRKVHKGFIQDLIVGYEGFGEGEFPPPSALAGRRKKQGVTKTQKRTKSMGLALWSLWGSKHDKMTMDREKQAEATEKRAEMVTATGAQGQGSRSYAEIETQDTVLPTSPKDRSRSRRRRVTYERQDEEGEVDENTTAEELLAQKESAGAGSEQPAQLLTPDYQPEVGIGTTGKRAYVDGIAVPFSLNKEAETASMMTLMSNTSLGQNPGSPRVSMSRSMSPVMVDDSGGKDEKGKEREGLGEVGEDNLNIQEETNAKGKAVLPPAGAITFGNTMNTDPIETSTSERPGVERFVTAAETLPNNVG